MVAPFLNKDDIKLKTSEKMTCPLNILDLTLRDLIKEWSENLYEFIFTINNKETLRWQDRYGGISRSLAKNRRIFYLGITLILLALILFFLEVIH